MKVFLPLLALLAWASAEPLLFEPLTDLEIFYINNIANTTWKAGRNPYPRDLQTIKRLLGVNMEKLRAYNRLHLKYKDVVVRDDLPAQFDPRTKWPDCPSLNEIRDQGSCGSCWAFGTSSVMTDRICIKGGGNVHISAEDLNNCCYSCSDGAGLGCNGGSPTKAWKYYVERGVVTGGQYGTKQGCMPYSFKPCDHTDEPGGKYPPCSGSSVTPNCTKSCIAGYPKTYSEDKRRGAGFYGVKGVASIMQELVNNGPVTAAFYVYADFTVYKSGVYKHVHGRLLAGHAVKILGYGTEDGQDYWLVANSWNDAWGDKGYFKIARGNDECSIESDIVTGVPLL